MPTPSWAPHPKIASAATGAAIAAPVAVLTLYLLATYANFNPPPAVSDAITVIITSVVSLISGYLTPAGDPPAPKGP